MEEIETAYIGSSEQFILSLLTHPLLRLSAIIAQEGRFPDSAITAFHKLGIDTRIITGKQDLNKIPEWIKTENALMYNFGMILPRELAQSLCICNVHPGSLATNRGPHPIGRSILNGETSTCLSLHRIDHRIDLGLLIATYEVPIYGFDDEPSVERRLFEGMHYILDEYIAFLNGERQGKIINDGVYYPQNKANMRCKNGWIV
jgi:methionyl-tRNA formyltransferase